MTVSKRRAMFVVPILLAGFYLSIHATHSSLIEQTHAQGLTPERRAELEAELAELEREITVQREFLEEKQRESTSLERDIAILDAQIQRSRLSIRARNLAIESLTSDIAMMAVSVEELDEKIEREKESLAQLIRRTDEADNFSLVEILLNSSNLSDFFQDVDSYNAIKDSLHKSFAMIEQSKMTILNEKSTLEEKRMEEQQLREAQLFEQQSIERDEAEKRRILAETRGEEQAYQALIAKNEQDAAAIRSALFELRDATAIPFGDALTFAERASERTGVRPALILAILKQESDLGANVGTCNRAGDPPEKMWDRIMPGPEHYANYVANGRSCVGAASPCSWRDDQSIFKEITAKLGLDHTATPLSCPIASIGGWGGAMGPSQFIPSTWRSFESQLSQILGVSVPNPWNPEHAITATALLLTDNGAAGASPAVERRAAIIYFAGLGGVNNPSYAFYGDQVMRHAAEYQRQINILQGN